MAKVDAYAIPESVAAATTPAVAYIRVSTGRQGRSGLGLAAQRSAIETFAGSHGYTIAAWFSETETGKGFDALERRPQLAAAVKAARALGRRTPVIVAKLDRLSRDVHFISGFMAQKVPFVVADLGPDVDPFVLHIFAAAAEMERNRIAQRTRDALAAAKARGVQLGDPDFGRRAAVRNRAIAAARAAELLPIFVPLVAARMSAREIAAHLNDAGITTPEGGTWSLMAAWRTRKRLGI